MLRDLENKSSLKQVIQQIEQTLAQTLSEPERARCFEEVELFEPTLSKTFWRSRSAASGICVVLAGKVRLLDTSNNLITSLKVGNSFGELTLFPQDSFSPYYAKASNRLKIAYLSRKLLEYLIAHYPKIEAHLHQQAILQELLLLFRQNPLFKNSTSEGLIPTLSLLGSPVEVMI